MFVLLDNHSRIKSALVEEREVEFCACLSLSSTRLNARLSYSSSVCSGCLNLHVFTLGFCLTYVHLVSAVVGYAGCDRRKLVCFCVERTFCSVSLWTLVSLMRRTLSPNCVNRRNVSAWRASVNSAVQKHLGHWGR